MSEKEEVVMIDAADCTANLSVPCIICGAFVDLNERESESVLHGHRPVKVCHECKGAVMFIKRKMMQAGL